MSKVTLSKERMYDIIRAPVITEKATMGSEHNQGKVKRFRGRVGQRSDIKKAVITLESGHTIDVTTGV